MKQLHEFATAQEARDYPYTGQRFISKSTMSLYLDKVDLFLYIIEVAQGKHDGIEIHKAKSACLMIVKALDSGNSDGKDFNFIQGHPLGDGVIKKLDTMINETMTEKAAELTQLKAICINHCNPVSKPYENISDDEFALAQPEELTLPENNEQHILTLSINKSVVQPLRVDVMQRFGDSQDDMTDWHVCGGFSNVRFKQEQYKCMVPANPGQYRELKLACSKSIGMSIN